MPGNILAVSFPSTNTCSQSTRGESFNSCAVPLPRAVRVPLLPVIGILTASQRWLKTNLIAYFLGPFLVPPLIVWVLWKQMLRWTLGCKMFIRGQFVWREGGTRIGQRRRSNHNTGQTNNVGSNGVYVACQGCLTLGENIPGSAFISPTSFCHWCGLPWGKGCLE